MRKAEVDLASIVDEILESLEEKELTVDEMQDVSWMLHERLELMEKEAKR